MQSDAEIDARVTVFVADLADLVRRLAMESVREAFASLVVAPLAKRHVVRRRRRRRAGPSSTTTPATRAQPRAQPPAPPAPPLPPPPVRVTRIPTKRRRADRAAPSASAPTPQAAAPVPAKSWVAVRRPARARSPAPPQEGPPRVNESLPPAARHA
jgi:hypothetical protein